MQWRRKRFTPSHFPSSKDVSHFRSTFNVIKDSLISKEDYIHLKIILIFKLRWDFRPCVLPFFSAALIARIDSWNTAKNMLEHGFSLTCVFPYTEIFYSYNGQSLRYKTQIFFLICRWLWKVIIGLKWINHQFCQLTSIENSAARC